MYGLCEYLHHHPGLFEHFSATTLSNVPKLCRLAETVKNALKPHLRSDLHSKLPSTSLGMLALRGKAICASVQKVLCNSQVIVVKAEVDPFVPLLQQRVRAFELNYNLGTTPTEASQDVVRNLLGNVRVYGSSTGL